MTFAAEAQIARELMKFAANGTLYRGSKPVMWSVVEKTALAEAEVEYEDYTSDHGVGEVSGGARRLAPGAGEDATALATNLVADAASVVIWTTTPWTLPGNRAISFSPKIAYGLYRVTEAPAGNWAKTGDLMILADKLAAEVFKQARVTSFERSARCRGCGAGGAALRASATPGRLRLRRAAARRRSRHRRHRHRLRAHRAGPWPRGLRDLDRERARAGGARHQSDDPLHRRRRRRLHRAGAGLHRQARHQRQGREGRRQRGGHQGADRGRQHRRARAAEASVSAFLALQEAGDLPQHAAMVHRHGQAPRKGSTARCAPSRCARSRRRTGCRGRARTASPA